VKSRKLYVRRLSKKDRFFSYETGEYTPAYQKFNKGSFVVTRHGLRNHVYDSTGNKTQLKALVKLLNMRKTNDKK